jgi:hypothetical protein
MRVEFEHEAAWRQTIAWKWPEATVIVLGRRQNRDDLSASVNGVEVGRYNRADDSPVEGWIEFLEEA